MKKTNILTRCLALLVLIFAFAAQSLAANTTTKVTKVSSTVTLTEDVDYVVTSAEPFGDNGVVDIKNTDHAVLILSGVKPSKALSMIVAHVKINGAKAVNGTNCQVKLYDRGTIVLPYDKDIKPLTVYSEKNYAGESCSDFDFRNNGGFMNTLTAEQLNNRIRSFKLKRGYMVTFSTLPNGRGYSRCFIAAYADREVAALPLILDGFISSYRLFKWYDASKAGLANDTRKAACDALNVQSCYSFSLGEDRGIDCECVPHHIYEDWPSAAACGQVTYSPHLKTNNEPGNSADDHPQSVETILNNWENLMATGMRLCSPSSHDGSWNHFRAVLDSIDARGWRCDILDIHSYWDKGSFGNLAGWYNTYKRPIWISEWVWGASWNNNGIFNTNVYSRDNPGDKEYTDNKNAIAEICNNMNGWDYVERYFYWNSEAPCSRVYDGGKLTPAGEWYAAQQPGLAYKASNEYVPKSPTMKPASNFKVVYNKTTMRASISWADSNGEWNKSMVLERSTDGKTWETLYTPTQSEGKANYSYADAESRDGYRYRVHTVDLNNKHLYSAVGTCTLSNATTGDGVTVDGKTMFIGGNQLINGDFEFGLDGWTNGKGNPIGAPGFQVVPMQLTPLADGDNSHYLFAWNSEAEVAAGSLKTTVSVVPNAQYYFSVTLKNTGGIYQSVSAGTTDLFKTQTASDWKQQDANFNVGDNSEITIRFRWLDKACMDKFILCRLFDTRDEAYVDGVAKVRLRAQAFINYNKKAEGLNAELQGVLDATTGTDAEAFNTIETALKAAIDAYNLLPLLQQALTDAQALIALGVPGNEELRPSVEQAEQLSKAADVASLISTLTKAVDEKNAFTAVNGISNPSFATNSNGWTKTSTYTGGDQRQNTVLEKTCWNAWWSVPAATAGNQTLAIEQVVNNLPGGYYLLACKATTQHNCVSDQHAFINNGTSTAVSPVLDCAGYDLPDATVGNSWRTLKTAPLFVSEGGSLTVGFQSSKQGAQSGAWSDNREGWWCATDFQLYYWPVYRRVAETEGRHWGTILMPQGIIPADGVKLYEVAGSLTEGDQRYICLSSITAQQPGVPCIYRSVNTEAQFFLYGDAVKLPVVGKNGLYGSFSDTYLYTFIPGSVGSIVFVDGMWRELTDDDFVATGSYLVPQNMAYLPTFDSIGALSEWDGLKMPINALAPDGIRELSPSAAAPSVYYGLDGRRVAAGTRGLVIERQNGKVKKVLRK